MKMLWSGTVWASLVEGLMEKIWEKKLGRNYFKAVQEEKSFKAYYILSYFGHFVGGA